MIFPCTQITDLCFTHSIKRRIRLLEFKSKFQTDLLHLSDNKNLLVDLVSRIKEITRASSVDFDAIGSATSRQGISKNLVGTHPRLFQEAQDEGDKNHIEVRLGTPHLYFKVRGINLHSHVQNIIFLSIL